jgi:dTDP-4-dehydrorhamnose 3,5-epimerase
MSLNVETTEIPAVRIVTPRKFGDHRGFFSETYNRRAFAEAGIDLDFVQDNHSLSADRGTIRGLHYQSPPFAQDKLVRVVRGAILDVAVDIRRGSPTFGRHVAARITAEDWNQILVPVGFAHGFVTLEPGTEVIYKVTNYYSREHDHGILWNDSALGIDWGLDALGGADAAVLSDKDTKQPRLAEIESPFAYEGD